jgi:hypothetical protein
MGFGAPIGVTLGMTRTQVKAALSAAEAFLPGNVVPFTAYYCSLGISVGYADMPDGSGNLAGTLSDDDVVTRLSTLAGFQGNTDTSIHLGSGGGPVETAYGTTGRAQVSDNVLGGSQDLYTGRGLAFGYDAAGNVSFIAVHKPYVGTIMPSAANAPMTLTSFKIGAGNAAIQSATNVLPGGDTFQTVKTVLGEPDTQGFANVGGQDIAYLSYGNAGIRVVGLKGNATSVDTVTTLQIYLTPPFVGFDTSTVGLGTTRAGWEAAYPNQGAGDFNGVVLQKYKTGTAGSVVPLDKIVGVAFAQDATCTDRAAMMVFNYFQ